MEPQTQAKTSNPDRWKPGKYSPAKPVDWMVTKTNAGLPQVAVLMEYKQPGDMPGTEEVKQLTWYGSFKDGALERTLEILEMLGLRQPPYPAMESGREGAALDVNAEAEVVVEHRVDQKGVRRAGVAWINRVGGRGIDSKLQPGEGAQVFAQANQAFTGYLAAKGIKVEAPAAAAPAAAAPLQNLGQQIASGTANFSPEDVPF